MEKRKLNVSGYRGVWGDTLTDEIVIAYTKAFIKFTKEDVNKENPSILVGRDGRKNGGHIRDIVIRELQKLNVNVVDGDILPTPTVLFSVRKHQYDGGIIVTASHDPIEYNGLKFINKEALFTVGNEVDKIIEYYEKYRKEDAISKNSEESKEQDEKDLEKEDTRDSKKDNNLQTPNFLKEHADHIVSNVNIEVIRSKKFKVAVDMINASACVLDPYLFKELGVELVPLNDVPNGEFAHRPEPVKENLTAIGELVKKSKANLGFAHDPDADRLVIIDENGEFISEEYSIVIAIENILSKNPGRAIVLNLSTSQMGADVAKKHGSECFRTKIGEGNVVDGMIAHNAIAGGEGNGGIIYPTINTVRDSFTGLSLVLELLAERNQTVSQCVKTFPKYFMKKDKWPIAGKNLTEIYSKLKNHFTEAKLDEQDGLRLDLIDGSWLHLRPSNTEPIIRFFGEAKTQDRINELFKEAENLII